MFKSKRIFKSFIIAFVLAAVFLTIFGCGKKAEVFQEDLYLFIIAIDGLRGDKLQSVSTPAIDSLIAEGAVTYNNRVSVPSQTRVGFVTLPTGAHADKHGILGSSYIDENWNSVRSDEGGYKTAQKNVLVPTIFEALESKGIRTAYIATKGYELVGGRGASIIFGGENIMPSYVWRERYNEKVDGNEEKAVELKLQMSEPILEKMINSVKNEGVRFFIANFGTLDYVGHSHGVTTKWYDMAVQDTDRHIQKFIDFLKQEGIYGKSVIIITADHGFTQILNPENVIMSSRYEPAVPELASAGIEHRALGRGGRSVDLHIRDKSKVKQAYDILKNLKWVQKIYSEHDLNGLDGTLSQLRYYFPGRSGDFFIDIAPTHTHAFKNKGQHGSTSDDDMIVPLVIWGQGVKQGVKLNSSNLVDVAPTALALYGLNPDDFLDADGKVLKEVLK